MRALVLRLSGLASLCLATALPASEQDRPSFVLILADDQGWTGSSIAMQKTGDESKSDYFETPHFERLVRQGMRFSNGYAPSPICTPSRRSLLFGQSPARQRGTLFESEFDPVGKLSLPLMLKSISPEYATAHFGKWGREMGASPEEVGFDESDGMTTSLDGGNSLERGRWQLVEEDEDPKRVFSVASRANDFMARQVEAGRPFYVQISHYAVHMTLQCRSKTLEKYAKKKKGRFHDNPAFAAMTEDMDTALGSVLDQVDRLGIGDRTYVFYLSDNGAVSQTPPTKQNLYAAPARQEDHGANHPLRSGKWTLYEGGLRVPFVVRGPGVQHDSVCDVPVVGWDVFPTLRDLAGPSESPEAVPGIDGVSFRPLLENGGEGALERPLDALVFHLPRPIGNGHRAHSSIRMGDLKLIRFWGTAQVFLFDLKKDRGERHDLALAHPEKVTELRDRMMAYLREVGAEIPE